MWLWDKRESIDRKRRIMMLIHLKNAVKNMAAVKR